MPTRTSDLQNKISSLEAQISAKDARISSLEEQLVSSSVEASREIATLRTTIFELEMGAVTERGNSREIPNESLADHRSKSKMLIPYDRVTSRESRKSSVVSDKSASSLPDESHTIGKNSRKLQNHSVPPSPEGEHDRSTIFEGASPLSASMMSPAFSSNRSSPIIFANATESASSLAPTDIRLPLDTLSTRRSTTERERSVSAKERVSSRDRQKSDSYKSNRIESLVVPIDSSRSDKDIRYPLV